MPTLKETNIPVVRNDIIKTHVPTGFKRGERKDRGDVFPCFSIDKSPESLAEFVSYYGLDNVVETLNSSYTINCQQIAAVVEKELKENMGLVPDSSEYNSKYVELITKYLSELTTRGETISELEEANDKINTQLADLVAKQTEAASVGDMVTVVGLLAEVMKMTETIKKNHLAIASKQRKRKTGDESEEGEVTKTPVPA